MKRVFEIDAENDPSVDAKLVAICINEHRRPEHAVVVREVFPAAGPWQDIKDAPKDGTTVLLWACLSSVDKAKHCFWLGYWTENREDGPGWESTVAALPLDAAHFALINLPTRDGEKGEWKHGQA